MKRIKGLSALAGSLVALLLVAQAVSPPAASAFARPKVAVAIKATPAKSAGKCPVTVTFVVKIKVGAPGRVAYRWLRGDGSKSAVKTVTVKGTATVRDRATFKGDLKGWQAIQVLSPRKVVSKKARFAVSCAPKDSGGGADDPKDGGTGGDGVDPQDASQGRDPDGSGEEQDAGTEGGR